MGRGHRPPKPSERSDSPLDGVKISQKTNPRVESLIGGTEIFQVHGVLTAEECKRFIDTAEGIGFARQSSRGPRFGEALRDNGRIQVQDPAFAKRLWEASGLRRICAPLSSGGASAVGLNPNIRIYRYTKGQHFGPHIDEAVQVAPGHWTGYTLLVYLSGSLSGGETVFYGNRGKVVASVAPEAGLALLHLHGEDDCLEHEAMEVQRGVKYVLRSDVVFA